MANEKVRIFALARELGMESKDLLALCRQNGIDIKNQLSTIEPELRDRIVKLVQSGGGTATATATLAPPKVLPDVNRPIRNLNTRPSRTPEKREPEPAPAPAAPAPAPGPTPAQTQPAAPAKPEVPPITPAAPVAPAAKTVEPPLPRPSEPTPVVHPPAEPAIPAPKAAPAAKAPEPVAPRPPETPAALSPEAAPTPPPTPTTPPPTPTVPVVPPVGGPRVVRNLDSRGSDSGTRRRERTPARPTMSFRPTPPPPLKVKPPEPKPQQPTGPKKIAEIPKELENREGPIDVTTIQRHLNQQAAKGTSGVAIPEEVLEEEEEARGKDKGKKRPGGVAGRDARHKERNARQEQRKRAGEATVALKTGRVADLIDLEDTPRMRTRLERIKKKQKAGPQPRKGKVPIEVPITVRSLSEAIGVRSGELLMKLMNHGASMNININSTIEPEMAEVLALEHGCELDVKRKADAEEHLLAEASKADKPEDLVPRAPVVTIMGHVDHGKTSLLDKIRHSNVTATEAGGITQVIRAWRVVHNGQPITFLDTPGHEAFTKMRARGANVTDIAVIVVAADDGVMPQTEEAINHAKAAGVSIIVAINKVDLPNANIRKTEQQLYGLGLIPDNMGGDVPFVQTSAATGKGIFDPNGLLDQILTVAELKELKANPNKPATGTCLEANLNEEEGVFATLLVREGTLHRGDVLVCGATYGRVRQLYDDLGRHIQEAGPTVPVRITGLDEVPNADDPFHVVFELAEAREIAEKRKDKQQEAALVKRAPLSLESLSEKKITELKVILKADARGSIEAIRKELEKLQHEEVRVRILEAAIGGITENDVWLALTSPEDTLILGFNVVPDERAQSLAEERGVQIRQYNIIYNLTDDVRSALEGKLKPREEMIHLGRAVVRETFKISRVGTIAGCYVTQGTIERSAKVRVIRSGVVVYPPPERTVGLESLKRFKEDVREVREGFECGLKVAGYDDIKVDDVIEAYRIEQVQRTLS